MRLLNLALAVSMICFGCASTMHIQTGNVALTGANIEKIQQGMTMDEVSAILGKPSSKSSAPPIGEFWTYSASDIKQTHSLNPLAPTKTEGVARAITITFDDGGKVKSVAKSENDVFQPMTVSFV